MKTCGKCKTEKPLTDFYKHNKWGTQYSCKVCQKDGRIYNKEKQCIAAKKWRAKNPEKAKSKVKRWRANNPEKVRAAKRKWDKENRDKSKQRVYQMKWAKANPDGDGCSRLTDGYVSALLGMKASECATELIKAKRLHLQIKRKLKELKA